MSADDAAAEAGEEVAFAGHTFCSHLAMRGAAPKAIQELVGHSTLTMTLRYMHLAPSALTEAIGLLNFGQPVGNAVSGSC